jgi:uncharacterized membrane protein YkoI
MKKAVPLLALVFAALASPTLAQTEQDDIMRCVSAGRCKPLSEILQIVQGRVPGQIVGPGIDEAQARFGVFIYRVTVLQDGGKVVRVDVDARSGRVLAIEGR